MTLSAGRRLRLTSILLGLLVTANALSARQSPDRWQQLAATLHEAQIANQVPALGLALFDAGQPVLIGGYGAADAQTPSNDDGGNPLPIRHGEFGVGILRFHSGGYFFSNVVTSPFSPASSRFR